MSLGELADLRRQREMRVCERSPDEELVSLCGWQALWGLIDRGAFSPGEVRVFYNRRKASKAFFTAEGQVSAAMLRALIPQGVSLIFGNVHRRVPALVSLCSDAGSLGAPITQIQAIATAGAGGAFQKHFDRQDLFVVQIEGRKRWRISGPPADRLSKPVTEDQRRIPTSVVAEPVLSPGDAMFLPAGFWHECDNLSDRSLHLSVLLRSVAR